METVSCIFIDERRGYKTERESRGTSKVEGAGIVQVRCSYIRFSKIKGRNSAMHLSYIVGLS